MLKDAVNAVLELYEDTGKKIPSNLIADEDKFPLWFESLVFAEDRLNRPEFNRVHPCNPCQKDAFVPDQIDQ